MAPAAWAAWIALAAVAFSGIQAAIALRKLRLDLFAKRFDAWEAVNAAINARQAEFTTRDPTIAFQGDTDAVRQFFRQQRLMRVLFPVDVTESLTRINGALIDCEIAQMEFASLANLGPHADPKDLGAKNKALMDAGSELREAQDQLMRAVHPYVRQYGWMETGAVHARRWLARSVASWKRP